MEHVKNQYKTTEFPKEILALGPKIASNNPKYMYDVFSEQDDSSHNLEIELPIYLSFYWNMPQTVAL